MRRARLLLVCLLGLATCSGLDNLDVEAEGQATIPQRTIIDELLGPLSFAGFGDVDITQSQEFQNQGYTRDQIDSVRIIRFTLAISSPSGQTFDFLDSIAFTASAQDLPEVEIARLDAIPPGATHLELQVDSSVELQPYVVAPSMTLTSKASGRRPENETVVDAVATFDVDVNVSGAACAVSPSKRRF